MNCAVLPCGSHAVRPHILAIPAPFRMRMLSRPDARAVCLDISIFIQRIVLFIVLRFTETVVWTQRPRFAVEPGVGFQRIARSALRQRLQGCVQTSARRFPFAAAHATINLRVRSSAGRNSRAFTGLHSKTEVSTMDSQLYCNGTILTMEEPSRAQALLVRGGRIAAVGERKTLKALAGASCEEVDLAGRTLMPAFIDPHSHFSAYANSLLQVAMEGVRSEAEIADKLRRYIADQHVPAGQWVVAKGYDHNDLPAKRPPDKALLDAAAPDNPVLLQHQSGHNGVLNTRALEALGITPDTKAPEGGRIGVANGVLTGFLEENAFMQALQKVPMPSAQDLLRAYDTAQDRYAGYGITTLQDGMTMDRMAPLYAYLCGQKRLRLDLVSYLDTENCSGLLEQFAQHVRQYKDHFKIGGYKIFLDGSPQSRTAWMREPYLNAPDGYRGYPTLTDEQVTQRVARAVRENMQILAHCNGDAAAQQYIDAYARALREAHTGRTIRPVIVHAQLIGEDQLRTAAALGMIPSFFAAHVYHWGDVHIQNFGLARAQNISPAAAAQKLGMPYTFHQDAPVIEPDMLETVWCAANRVTKAGTVLGAAQRVSVQDALRAVTVNAAYQYFEEADKGSLRAGKRADLVVLSEDPLACDPARLREIRVWETYKDGVRVYRRA